MRKFYILKNGEGYLNPSMVAGNIAEARKFTTKKSALGWAREVYDTVDHYKGYCGLSLSLVSL